MILSALFWAAQFSLIIVLLAILWSSRQRSKYEKILKNLNAECCPGVGLGSIDAERDATILCRGLIVHGAEKHLVSPSQAGSIPAACVQSTLNRINVSGDADAVKAGVGAVQDFKK